MSEAEDVEAVALEKTSADLGRGATPDGEDAQQQVELEDRSDQGRDTVPFIVGEQEKVEKDLTKLKSDQTRNFPGNQDTDCRSVKAGTIKTPESEDSRLSDRGIHSLTQSVTDEVSRSISEVDDDDQNDQTDFSSENSICGSHPTLVLKSRDPQFEVHCLVHQPEQEDDFEGIEGEIDSESGGQSQEQYSEELTRRISSLNEILREGLEDEGLSQPLRERQDEQQQQSPEAQFDSDLEDVSSIQKNPELENTVSHDTEVDVVSYLGTLATEPQDENEESAQQPRPDSEISAYYIQQLDLKDAINPFSLEDRIRKAREQQDLSLEWEADNMTDVGLLSDSVAGDLQSLSNLDEISHSIFPEPEEKSSDQPAGSSERAFENLLASEVKERNPESIPQEWACKENEAPKIATGAGEAILLGALASGVNRPTWFVVRAVLVALVASLVLLLHVAVQSDSLFVLLNVLCLIVIAGGLILLLSWYISEIGLVSVDKQRAELHLTSESDKVKSKSL